MENKTFLIIIFAVITISLISFFTIKSYASPQVSPSALEECNTLKYSGENALNIVFFSDKNLAEKYSSHLLKTKPYDKYEDAFNFYYINLEPECELYKGIALFCHSKELLKKVASCPNDFIVVLQEKDSSIRSSNYLNVLSINSKHPLSTFIHEFAHAFMTLDDEYVPASLTRNSKNCMSSCSKFKSETDGCFQGCSNEGYYRSIETGVMRTLSTNNYGVFDSALIEKELVKISSSSITGKATTPLFDCSKEKYYLVSGDYNDSGLLIKNSFVEYGCASKFGSGPYNYALTEENKILAKTDFNPVNFFTDIQLENSEILTGGMSIYNGSFSLAVPYVSEQALFKVYDENSQEVASLLLEDKKNQACIIK